MKTAPVLTALTVAAAVSAHLPLAQADELRVLSSVGIQAVLEELVPEFERSTGHEVTLVFDLASALKTKIEGGEAFDVAILTPPLLDDLIAKGLITAETRAVLARVGLGLMIRAGAPKPDVSSVDAFKRTLLDANSLTYAPAGASGVAFVAIADRLGIAAEVAAKTVIVEPKAQIAVTGPHEMIVGEPGQYKFVLSNNGNVDLKGVFIRTVLPEGLDHAGGRDLEYEVGDLPRGKSKEIPITLQAAKAGSWQNQVLITQRGRELARTTTDVTASVTQVARTSSGESPRRNAAAHSTASNTSTLPVRITTCVANRASLIVILQYAHSS